MKGTFGLDNGNATNDMGSVELALQKFQNNWGTGTLTQLELKIEDQTPYGVIKMAIYADDGSGHPGQLLCYAEPVNTTNGWVIGNDLSNKNVQLIQGQYYWLGFNISSSSTVAKYNSYGANTRAYTDTWNSNNDWPQDWSTYTPPISFTYGWNPFVMRARVTLPDTTYEYNQWGTINSQNIKTTTNIDATHSLWSVDYFDGLGRVIQSQAQGESGHTIISSTTVYNNRGQVDKKYVSQDISQQLTAYYTTGISNWKYTGYSYDGLGRVTQQTNPDGITTSNDYSIPWQTATTNERGFQTTFTYDAYGRLTQVQNNPGTVNQPTLPEPAVSTNDACGITSTGAVLNGNLGNLGTASSVAVSFEYGTTTAYGNTTAVQNMTIAGKFSASISSLSANTTYHYRAIGVGSGNSYGNDMTFTTSAASNMTLDKQIASGGDDAADRASSASTSWPTHTLGYSTYAGESLYQGFRFTTINIPQGAAITAAYLQVQCNASSSNIINLKIAAEAADNPAAPNTTNRKPSTLWASKTSAAVDWDVNGSTSWTVSNWYNSPDISAVIQEIVNRGGWASGNSIMILIANDSGINNRVVNAYETSPAGAPKLHIEYSATTPPAVTTNNASNITNTSATLNASLSYLGTATSIPVSFEYGLTTDYGNTIVGTSSPMTSPGTFTANLTGLTPNTTYHYRAKAIGDGNSYGSDQLFTTLATGSPSAITTTYTYDALGNLTDVYDNDNNHTHMDYDWLSRKTAMSDPDMGDWSYEYDNNGNLISQTDAKGQTITLSYDALNRLTGKTYPAGSGMTNVSYNYDSTADGNYGKGKRTGMSDALGTNSATFKYDSKGRLIQESKVIDSTTYTTGYEYDGADRMVAITYPNPGGTGETVTQTYNDRGLPDSLSGSAVGDLVTGTLYNALGSITSLSLGNGAVTTYGYWGTGEANDTTGGYYGRLWEIKTVKAGNSPIQDIQHTWDAGGNLIQRQNVKGDEAETESFTYDYLDRLTSASGLYREAYTFDEAGNITSRTDDDNNTYDYTYGENGAGPHAVTTFGEDSYTYDANGNMASGDGLSITWDVENRPVSITKDGVTTDFVYDGDGNRMKKVVDDGQTVTTTLYVNKYYEKTDSIITTHYYLGNTQIAVRKDTTLSYIQQDSLSGTSVISDTSGNSVANIKYFAFGSTRSSTGTLPTDKLFTGQRLDSTGLYYYGARYYDPIIGRFISADIYIQDNMNPQTLNRYSYVLNEPLSKTDPTGWDTWGVGLNINLGAGLGLSGSIMLVWDSHGGIALVSSGGGGGYAGVGGSLTVQGQWTTADRVQDLAGSCIQTGGSYDWGPTVGGEWVAAKDYQGINVLGGVGIGLAPVELHSSVETAGVITLRDTQTQQESSSQPVSQLPASDETVSTASPEPANPPAVSSGSTTTSVTPISSSSNIYSSPITASIVNTIIGNNNIVSNPATGSYAYSVSTSQNAALNQALGISSSAYSLFVPNW